MPYVVIVDSREYRTAEEVVKRLRRLGATVIQKMLDVGDYVVSDKVVIERKRASDFISSIVDGRLFEQAKKLADSCSRPVLILEGNLWSATRYRNVHVHAVLGALLTLALKFNVLVLLSRDPEMTAFYIYDLARLEQEKEKRGIKTVFTRKNRSIRELQIGLLSMLPGIGPRRAEKILQEFKTPLEALKNFKLWTRAGVPESTIALIRKILTTEYEKADEEIAEQPTIDSVVREGSGDNKRELREKPTGILRFFQNEHEDGQRSNPSS